jgi:drug/metabolite transporter (DMT)-like permease
MNDDRQPPPKPLADPALARRGLLVMLFSVAVFTVNTLLLKHLGSTEHVSTLSALFFRALAGIIIVMLFFRGKSPARIRPVFTERRLITRGFTGLLGTACYYWTVPALGAGKATLISTTYVVFAALIAAWILHEHLAWGRLGWMLVAFVGVVLLSGVKSATVLGLPEGIALLGAITAAVTVVLIRQLSAVHSIGTIYLAQCVWILLPILPFTLRELGHLTPHSVAILTVAAISASYGQLAMNEGYRCLAVSTGASIQMIWPVLTSIGGIVCFQEHFSSIQIAGAAIILLANWVIAVRREPLS